MADNQNINVKVQTAYDGAGIKATEKDIDSISKKIKTLDASGIRNIGRGLKSFSAAGLFSGITKELGTATMRAGTLATVLSKLGPIGAKVGGAIAAAWLTLKTVPKIISTIGEGFRGLGKIWSGGSFTELVKNSFDILDKKAKTVFKNASYSIQEFFTGTSERMIEESQKAVQKAAHDKAYSTLQSYIERRKEGISEENKEYDKQLQKVDRVTQAIESQIKHVQKMQEFKGNSELLALEQRRQDQVSALRQQGKDDEAKQLDKAYDVAIEQMKAQQELNSINAQIEAVIQQRASIASREKDLQDKITANEKTKSEADAVIERMQTALKSKGAWSKRLSDDTSLVEEYQKRLNDINTQLKSLSGELISNSTYGDPGSRMAGVMAIANQERIKVLEQERDSVVKNLDQAKRNRDVAQKTMNEINALSSYNGKTLKEWKSLRDAASKELDSAKDALQKDSQKSNGYENKEKELRAELDIARQKAGLAISKATDEFNETQREVAKKNNDQWKKYVKDTEKYERDTLRLKYQNSKNEVEAEKLSRQLNEKEQDWIKSGSEKRLNDIQKMLRNGRLSEDDRNALENEESRLIEANDRISEMRDRLDLLKDRISNPIQLEKPTFKQSELYGIDPQWSQSVYEGTRLDAITEAELKQYEATADIKSLVSDIKEAVTNWED